MFKSHQRIRNFRICTRLLMTYQASPDYMRARLVREWHGASMKVWHINMAINLQTKARWNVSLTFSYSISPRSSWVSHYIFPTSYVWRFYSLPRLTLAGAMGCDNRTPLPLLPTWHLYQSNTEAKQWCCLLGADFLLNSVNVFKTVSSLQLKNNTVVT